MWERLKKGWCLTGERFPIMRKAVRVESNRKPNLFWYTPELELATDSTDPCSLTKTNKQTEFVQTTTGKREVKIR